MLPIERRKKIKQLLQQKTTMKISELSKQLGVSEMTVHRDLTPLIDEGVVTKTFGGVSINEQKDTLGQQDCTYCHRPLHPRLMYRIILHTNEHEFTCCAHCGLLRQRELGDRVSQAICYDFLKQTTISASLASFVIESSVDIGCCKPQVLTFDSKEHAEKFVTGFGGSVHRLQEAIDVIYEKMQGT